MLFGHGDDTYQYEGIRMNFSSNIYAHADLSGLEEHLCQHMKVIRSYPEPSARSLERMIAQEYGIDVDYSNCRSSQEDETTIRNTLTSNRQSILNQLLSLADKGDWVSGIASENVKTMLKSVLGLGESTLTGKKAEQSEKLWNLLENGRGDRVKIVWQNMVGYLDDKKLFRQKGSPALNKDFFGEENGYSNIDKGRPSRENMSSGFCDVLPLLDAYCPEK